jgi:hypothetical protein
VLTTVTVAYTDVTAASLCLALDLPPQPALDVAPVDLGGITVELRVLGASHQVLIGDAVSETVACLGGASDPLPERVERPAGGLTYRFASAVERLAPEALRERAGELRDRAAADPHALAAVFPGSPHALTALSCRRVEGGVAWTTVHLYPGPGEVVTTESVLR